MKEIELKFGGSIYMEDYGEQEEEDRIKVYDSNKEYLEYFSTDWIIENITEIYQGMSIQEALDFLAYKIEEKESIVDLLDFLGVEWEAIFPNTAAATHSLDMDSQELDNNEWINHIGKYYIKIYEY